REPAPGCSSLSFISAFLNHEHVNDLVDHAAVFRCIGDRHRLMHAAQAQTTHTGTVIPETSGGTLDERNLDLVFCISHFLPLYAVSSSTRLPRLRAISSGSCMLRRPSTVARTILMGLREP